MKKKLNIHNYRLLISHRNLPMLDGMDKEDIKLVMQKLYDWQEEYDHVKWSEFRDYWTLCDLCESYTSGSCICYAR